ncbi:MAG TPA: M23 family metallopeptidase [Thermoanaerobaculia bacterium]|jgi:hypothetical protein
MTNRIFLTTLLASTLALAAHAQTAAVREIHATALSAPDANGERSRTGARRITTEAVVANDAAGGHAVPFGTFPVAGTIGRDLAMPYFVDLDPTNRAQDWNCGNLTFNDHSGEDAYIRSFREQEIGVPVFAVRDGRVTDVRDGQPDQNTSNDTTAKANFITIRHSPDEITQYVHLKKGSITVARGDQVVAGQQIAMIGSSGASTAPHIHFEARWQDEPFEPMAGPCRPGKSYFPQQPMQPQQDPIILGATFSGRSFAEFRPAPFDDAPHTGTFLRGPQTIYFKADLANVGARTQYALTLTPPNSTTGIPVGTGSLMQFEAALASVWWAIDVNLNVNGVWTLAFDVNGSRIATLPFTVVESNADVFNRPPNPITAAIEPAGLLGNEVPVCRVSGDLVADPDYEVVSYRYQWRVNDVVVRDVTTAAESDALSRTFSRAGTTLSCTVIASDGRAEAQPASANVLIRGIVHRRSVRQ